MTDDLKERLRKGIISDSLHEDNETELFDVDAADELCEDALERIEQLEAALREIAYTEPDDKYWPGRIARKALEGGDE